MTNLINRFKNDESGATAIEYGLIAGLLSVVIVGTVSAVGGSLTEVFDAINTELQGALTPAA